MRDIVLSQSESFEDELTFTAVPRDIYRAYPESYRVHIVSGYPELWRNNPYIGQILQDHPEKINIPAPTTFTKDNKNSCKDKHDLEIQLLSAQKTIPELKELHLTEFRPCYRLPSECALTRPDIINKTKKDKCWAVYNGWSADNTVRRWDGSYWRRLVKLFKTKVNSELIQIAINRQDETPAIPETIQVIGGKIELQTVSWILQHTHGVITTAGAMPHLAAALCKPCVVIASADIPRCRRSYSAQAIGRWYGTVPDKFKKLARVLIPQEYISAQSVCKKSPCLENLVVKCPNRVEGDRMREDMPDTVQPSCLKAITPATVVNAVLGYEDRYSSTCYDMIDEAVASVFGKIQGD